MINLNLTEKEKKRLHTRISRWIEETSENHITALRYNQHGSFAGFYNPIEPTNMDYFHKGFKTVILSGALHLIEKCNVVE